jgi:beta-glucuronidase
MKIQNLNGIWEFAFTDIRSVNPEFDSRLPVPGCFDALSCYFGKRGVGWYRRNVVCGGNVQLSFTAGLHAEVFWDGIPVGETALPYTREEFLFDSGIQGEHELLIVTDNLVSGDAGEQFKLNYDFYGYGGIYNDVELAEFEFGDVRHIEVIPLDFKTGEVKLKVECFNAPPDALNIAFDSAPAKKIKYASELTLKVPDFRLWSPESPFLHKVIVNGFSTTFGIRTLDWSGTRLLLNGKPLKLIGCNRHESHPEFGAAVPDFLTASDLVAAKQQGFNFIRGSHYPQKETMLELCDRLGILVWEETLGWGNRKEHLTDPVFQARQEEQCRKMVRKSMNHPSVIIWGFLNEAQTDLKSARPIISQLYSSIRKLDPTRPITFGSNCPDVDVCFDLVDMVSLNIYPGWYGTDNKVEGACRIRPRLEELAEKFKEKPLLVSEIGVSGIAGDHSGFRWSEEFQERYIEEVLSVILENKRYTGVALWQFCDSRTYLETDHFLMRPRGFNNKGLLDEYRRPKQAWNALKSKKLEAFCGTFNAGQMAKYDKGKEL